MNARAWLAQVPEPVRRRVFTAASDVDKAVVAVRRATAGPAPGAELLSHLPGIQWFSVAEEDAGSVLALCVGDGALVQGALRSHPCDVVNFPAQDLCVPVGAEGTAPAFAREATAIMARKDGLALWRRCAEELKARDSTEMAASAIRWIQTALEVEHPRQALVKSLVGCAATGAWVPPPSENVASAQSPGLPDLRQQAAWVLQSQARMLAVPCEPRVAEGRIIAAATVLDRVLAQTGMQDFQPAAREAAEQALKVRSPAPLRTVIVEVLHQWKQDEGLEEEGEAAATGRPDAARAEDSTRQVKILKVESGRIDSLMDIVGELIVAKNTLPFLAKRADEEFGCPQLARTIRDEHAVVNRIAESMQDAVMRLRMVPMSQVFRRFPRLVRDLSGKLKKRVRLDLVGEETEADKDVVEDLFDPLMHIVRNSMDHGLEAPDERARSGKPPEGVIRLAAARREDQVVLELSDDGRGIDPAKIRASAVAKGFLTEEKAAALSNDEALQLILLPGFSTAEQVTELSGRGVGMDVVRSMVGRVGGRLTLQSTLGKGTLVTITLPLTMAVSHVMVVEAGGVALGIPFGSIAETVRVERAHIKHVDRHEVLVLRKRLVPLCRLSEALALGRTERAAARGTEAVLVISVGGHELGLVVDEFHQGVDIIMKPLEGVMKGLRLFSGTALLGDGRVLLVLDVRELTQHLQGRAGTSRASAEAPSPAP
jgi:two-component system chemotaxis sensor kinase CheA